MERRGNYKTQDDALKDLEKGFTEEKECLKHLTEEADDTINYLSNQRKKERERGICAAFLKCLGINYKSDEIVSIESNPPDIMFRSAHFEVIEILNQDRKRHDEWRKEKELREKALTLKDISQSYRPPEPLSYEDILNLISDKLLQKTIRYKERKISIDDLDALVYVNLKDKFFDTSSSLPSFERLFNQGWRSVSMIMPYYSYIFYSKESAPEFLKKYVEKPKSECTDYSSNIFEVRKDKNTTRRKTKMAGRPSNPETLKAKAKELLNRAKTIEERKFKQASQLVYEYHKKNFADFDMKQFKTQVGDVFKGKKK